ncbi:MAG: ABC transporter permease [Anaerolineales bacterium]|nr:ABC transporter permease [Anaerolineales bacterium]
MGLAFYLAFKEVWRNKGRFLLVSLVIALITLLVLFIAALGEGLGTNNREYISKLDGQLVVFLEKSDYIITASRLRQSTLRAVRRVEGVDDAGPVSTSNTAILLPPGSKNEVLKVSLLGVEAGRPGFPQLTAGRTFLSSTAREVIVDQRVLDRTDIQIGDTITIRSTQGVEDNFYDLKVVGTTSGQAYFFQPSIFVTPAVWEKIRPKSDAELGNTVPAINIIVVRVKDPAQIEQVRNNLLESVKNIEVADIQTTINNIPGYTAQQGTVQTQGGFTLLIGILVIGGFFQIQVLQKVPQIGVLKAIGASNPVVGAAAVIQISLVTAFGVAIGGVLTWLFSLGVPPTVPLFFNGTASALALAALLAIGPLGGLVSVIYAVRIEPLKALRLS